MKKCFWIPIALGLTAYLTLPMPGQSASLNDKIERKERQVEKKKRREGVLTDRHLGVQLADPRPPGRHPRLRRA